MTSSLAGTDFNPHSRVGSDDRWSIETYFLKNFNPHSRVGSDAEKTYADGDTDISIHTPA